MPKEITDVLEFTSPVTAPLNGDPVTGASIETPVQALANRTHWLNTGLAGVGGALMQVRGVIPGFADDSGGSHDLYPQVVMQAVYNASSRFLVGAGSILQTDATDQGGVIVPLVLPPRGVINGMQLWVHGGSGHSGMPATKPAFALLRVTPSHVEPVSIAALLHPATTLGQYETLQQLVMPVADAPDTVIGSGAQYYLAVTGETGADSQPGFRVRGYQALIGLVS